MKKLIITLFTALVLLAPTVSAQAATNNAINEIEVYAITPNYEA